MVRPVAIDIGNYAIKGLFAGLKEENELYIPNVIAPMGETRDTVEMEKKSIDGLHVEVVSTALHSGKGIYAVGNLATKIKNNDELTTESKKSESDQPVILLLAALAYDAAQNKVFNETDEGVIEATYILSTGLPLAESKTKGTRKRFKEKLLNGQHQIRFLDTPYLNGKIVRIKFLDVVVNSEGHAAMIDLTTNDSGETVDKSLTEMTLLIQDIGGLSTDGAIITPEGIDNEHSDGISEGVSPYLDEIMLKVQKNHGYRFKSRRELVDILITDKTDEQFHIHVKGKPVSIKGIVDEVLTSLAREEFKLMKRLWEDVPAIRFCYMIGGGASILRPYIIDINKGEYPIRFIDNKISIWMIARAYYKLLLIYIQRKGLLDVVLSS